MPCISPHHIFQGGKDTRASGKRLANPQNMTDHLHKLKLNLKERLKRYSVLGLSDSNQIFKKVYQILINTF